MGERDDARTRASLLARLAHAGSVDESARRGFVELYGRQIYKWCRAWQLQDADAQEVTQQVLAQLVTKMQSFVYDPARSFRAWLKTVTHHAWRNLAVKPGHVARGSGDSGVLDQLLSVPARDDLAQRLEEEYDRELMEKAMLRVRLRVAPHTWEAFRLIALDGVPVKEAAQRLRMKAANVYVAKSNVRRMLQEEMEKLDGNAMQE
jgi:RNA polymerase sigma-70 factor (ECF subfamily)